MRCLAALSFAVMAGIASAAEPEIRLVETDGAPVAIEVTGLRADVIAELASLAATDQLGPRTLSVYVGKQFQKGQPPLSGSYQVADGKLALHAAVSPARRTRLPGRSLSTCTKARRIAGTLRARVRAARSAQRRAGPHNGGLPFRRDAAENQLRFYLHFATPMVLGEAYDHLLLLKENGQPVLRPFLEIGEELWDNSRTRLTLLIDPGRIKRGLSPREEHGPVLEAGGKYTLVVTKGWQDAAGQPLAEDFRKSFTAGPPVETAIDYKAGRSPRRPVARKGRSLSHSRTRSIGRLCKGRSVSNAPWS